MMFGKRNTGLPEYEEDKPVEADMNMEGMPWYGQDESFYDENDRELPLPELDKKELRRITVSATLAGLLFGSVFMIAFFLFIMFCVNVWFK